MFAIPGVVALIVFIYVRPQEVFPALQSVPFLYLFLGLAMFGLALDLRLKISRPAAAPQLPWAILFFLWCVITLATKAPHHIVAGSVEVAIAVTLFAVIAHSVQSFRALHVIAATLLGLVLFLAIIGIHQGRADFGCVQIPPDAKDLTEGVYDGRACELPFDCVVAEGAEPGAEYMCERIGLLATTSVAGGRVRYRGVLQDPNELSLAIGMGMLFAFAFYAYRRGGTRLALAAITVVLAGICVYYTRSRGGQLVFLTGIFAYFVQRYRWRAVAAAMVLAIPLAIAMRGGPERRDAEASTGERLDAWATGFEMARPSPLLGVGQGQFGEYHYLTAHNSYVLPLAELGVVGLLLFSIILYLCVKISVVALRRYGGVPEARVAASWAMAMLASLAGMFIGIFFLSWTYHMVLWIWVGLSGALYSAIKTHDPGFQVGFGARDFFAVVAIDIAVLGGLFVYLRVLGV